MRSIRLALVAALTGLSACSANQATRTLATAQEVVSDGQLVCQVGPTAFAMLDPSGAAILAKGATKAAVDQTCALVNGVATALPSVSVQPASVVVALPASVAIPLKG